MTLPLPRKYEPMEAQPAEKLPEGPEWHYEPKWDGFRCLAFRDGAHVDLESKSGKPLTRYFPELVRYLPKCERNSLCWMARLSFRLAGNCPLTICSCESIQPRAEWP